MGETRGRKSRAQGALDGPGRSWLQRGQVVPEHSRAALRSEARTTTGRRGPPGGVRPFRQGALVRGGSPVRAVSVLSSPSRGGRRNRSGRLAFESSGGESAPRLGSMRARANTVSIHVAKQGGMKQRGDESPRPLSDLEQTRHIASDEVRSYASDRKKPVSWSRSSEDLFFAKGEALPRRRRHSATVDVVETRAR